MDSYCSIPLGQSSKDASFVPNGTPILRKRLSMQGILEVVLPPMIIFIFVFWLVSSEVSYYHPNVAIFLIVVLFMVPIGLGLRALQIHRRWSLGLSNRSPWMLWIAAGSVAIAAIVALIFGMIHFNLNTREYYDAESLSTVGGTDGLNPTEASGAQYVDVMTITFEKKTFVDESLSLGFKNGDLYCVAPIVTNVTPASYDFWAVGTNCCDALGGSFWCSGVINDPSVHTATRYMDVSMRPFFKFAVQQAEAEYGIKARHPLFFSWTKDPNERRSLYMRKTLKSFSIGIAVLAFLLMACVGCLLSLYSPSAEEL